MRLWNLKPFLNLTNIVGELFDNVDYAVLKLATCEIYFIYIHL